MEGRIFKRLIVAFVFSIVFIMIAKFFLGKTMGYLTEAAEQKRQTAAAQAVSAPVAASSAAEDDADDAEEEAETDPAAASGVLSSDVILPISGPAATNIPINPTSE